MTHRVRLVSEGRVYHVTARGVGRQIIFERDDDRQDFVDSMWKIKGECGVEVLAWCLMDNHVHLMLRGRMEDVSRMMHRLLGGYAMRFNARYGRVGHLFQGRFGSKPIEDDGQLLATLCYIHLNPTEVGADYESYPWSSFGAYVGAEKPADTALIRDILGGEDAFLVLHRNAVRQGVADGNSGKARRRLSAEEAREVIRNVLGELSPYELKTLDKERRDGYIAELRRAGMSIRQIERATGISRGIISRVSL